MHTIHHDQRGIGHFVILLASLMAITAIGLGGWRVANNSQQQDIQTDKSASTDEVATECKENHDKDICKFFTSRKEMKTFRMVFTEADGSRSVYEVDGSNSRISTSGENAYESITIDKMTFVKAGNTWYKYPSKTEAEAVTDDFKSDFEDPKDTLHDEDTSVIYKKLGTEKCMDLTCFKYEVVDPREPTLKQFIWFDDKDYQLRKMRTEGKGGEITEQIYEYSDISIDEPPSYKELAPNQYIVPGQTEPVTMPQ